MNIFRYMIAALTLSLGCAGAPLLGQKAPGKPISVSLDKLSDQHPQNVKTELVTYKGRKALRVIDTTTTGGKLGFDPAKKISTPATTTPSAVPNMSALFLVEIGAAV